VILAVGVTLAYRELSSAAEDLAQQRVKQVATQLSDLIAAGQPRTANLLRSAAGNPAVAAVLREPSPPQATLAEANAALAKIITPGDSGVGIAVTDVKGRVVISSRTSDMGPKWAEGIVEDLSIAPSRGVVTSPLYLSGGRIYYSTILPIISAGVRLGNLTQHRRLNASAQMEKDIAGLTGQDVGILFHNTDGSQWVTLGGKPVPAPAREETVHGMHTYVHDATRFKDRVLLAEAPVKNIPWVVALELPLSAIMAGPREMLKQFLFVSVALLLIGALAMWVIGRRVTVPLAPPRRQPKQSQPEITRSASNPRATARSLNSRILSIEWRGEQRGRTATLRTGFVKLAHLLRSWSMPTADFGPRAKLPRMLR
jgi:Signal transduction histidine kinase regulating citrate/malate metabolism